MLMSMTELAARAGLSLQTVGHYRALGLISPVMTHGVERYTNGALLRLEVVKKAKRLGFPLAEIKALLDVAPAGASDAVASCEDEGAQE